MWWRTGGDTNTYMKVANGLEARRNGEVLSSVQAQKMMFRTSGLTKRSTKINQTMLKLSATWSKSIRVGCAKKNDLK